MIALPVVIAARIATLLYKTTSDFCTLQNLSQNVKRTWGGGGRGATVLHLVVMNVEQRYRMVFASICERASTAFSFASTSNDQNLFCEQRAL